MRIEEMVKLSESSFFSVACSDSKSIDSDCPDELLKIEGVF
jgi:hypothetical protein